jgi:putative transposase
MILTYQYRLVPSKSQHRALELILESQRELYNAALEERIGARRRGINRSYFDQTKALTDWRRCDSEAASLPANLQRATLKRLDDAYKGFFRRVEVGGVKAGFPRFRGKGWWDSFGFREFSGISFDGRRLRFKGVPGAIKVHLHRPLPIDTHIRSCVFRRDPKGWKVGFAVEVPSEAIREERRSAGVDLGIRNFLTLSDGGFVPGLRAARRGERRIRLLQRSLARKKRGSKTRGKTRSELARCHARIARGKANFLHQASARLIRDYDLVAVEALNVLGLSRAALSRDVHDASWGKFLSMLRYKAERAGVRLVEVDPGNTSQDCSGCGLRVPKRLGERCHDCPGCGLSIDRDLNAARNILYRAGVGPGLRNVAECGMRAGRNLDLSGEFNETLSRAG